MSDAWHVVPVNDEFEHVTEGIDCWCGPELEAIPRLDHATGTITSAGYAVMHHAADGRPE